MDTTHTKVSIREFHAHFVHYANAHTPIAITRHGETMHITNLRVPLWAYVLVGHHTARNG